MDQNRLKLALVCILTKPSLAKIMDNLISSRDERYNPFNIKLTGQPCIKEIKFI